MMTGEPSPARSALYRGDLASTHRIAATMVARDPRDAEGHFLLGIAESGAGRIQAGIAHLGDADGALTRALGMEFSVPAKGLYGRSNRYALLVEDGIVTRANLDKPGQCDLSTGEALLGTV